MAEFLAASAQIGRSPLVIPLRRPDGHYDVFLRISGDYNSAEGAKYAAGWFRDELKSRAPKELHRDLRP
ncbi:hypothetical protein BH09ACT7_BH09ACT7_08420 [soil metagenome]